MQGKEQLKKPVHEFKQGIVQAKEQRQKAAKERTAKHRQTIADKRLALDKKRASSRDKATHERPVTRRETIFGTIIQQQKPQSNENEQLIHGTTNQSKQSEFKRKMFPYKERSETENKRKIRKIMKRPDKPMKVIKKRQLQKRSVHTRGKRQ